MGWLIDTLKEIPLSAVLKEKVAAIEDKYAATETQNKILEGDLRKANAKVAELQKQVEQLTHKDDLDETERDLIKLVASDIETGGKPAKVYAERLNLSPDLVQV